MSTCGCKCELYYTGMLYLHNCIFLTDIIDYDRLKFGKIYTPNAVLGTPLILSGSDRPFDLLPQSLEYVLQAKVGWSCPAPHFCHPCLPRGDAVGLLLCKLKWTAFRLSSVDLIVVHDLSGNRACRLAVSSIMFSALVCPQTELAADLSLTVY